MGYGYAAQQARHTKTQGRRESAICGLRGMELSCEMAMEKDSNSRRKSFVCGCEARIFLLLIELIAAFCFQRLTGGKNYFTKRGESARALCKATIQKQGHSHTFYLRCASIFDGFSK